MDPNQTLETLRSLVNQVDTRERTATDLEIAFAVAFENLDTWLLNGGFLPKVWEEASKLRRNS